MRNLGIVFLALVALFVGGCSVIILGFAISECWTSPDRYSCQVSFDYGFYFFAPVFLTISLLLALALLRKGGREERWYIWVAAFFGVPVGHLLLIEYLRLPTELFGDDQRLYLIFVLWTPLWLGICWVWRVSMPHQFKEKIKNFTKNPDLDVDYRGIRIETNGVVFKAEYQFFKSIDDAKAYVDQVRTNQK